MNQATATRSPHGGLVLSTGTRSITMTNKLAVIALLLTVAAPTGVDNTVG
jgi:hypothetical protein